MTKRFAIPATFAAVLALAACDPQTRDTVGAGTAGAGIAAVGAQLLGANNAWTVAAGAVGAAAGALYARNRNTGQCAYYTGNKLPNGDDEVVVRPCA